MEGSLELEPDGILEDYDEAGGFSTSSEADERNGPIQDSTGDMAMQEALLVGENMLHSEEAGELWSKRSNQSSSNNSSSGSSGFEDDLQEADSSEVKRKKRNALKTQEGDCGGFNQQSTLEGGYLQPAVNSSTPSVESATRDKEAKTQAVMMPSKQVTDKRRGGADWTAMQSKHRDEVLAQRDELKKDPAAAFRLIWEDDDEFPICMVISTLDAVSLDKAVFHYRSLPPAQSRRYHCLVNLACCLMSMSQPRPARDLLEQAILLKPHRAAARINLVHCLLKIRDRPNAILAIDQALSQAEDLNADDHRLLLWTKKDVAKKLSSKGHSPQGQRGQALGGSRTKRPESGSASGSGRQVRRRPVAGRQMLSRLEVWQMRKDLLALRGTDTAEDVQPPWRRRHIYSDDSEQAIHSKKARWQPLTPQELETVCRAFADLAKANAGECASDTEVERDDEETESNESSEDELEVSQSPQNKAAQKAYMAVRGLPCMQALAKEKAIALLEAGELVQITAGGEIFRQGDLAEHIFIIVKGAVMIKVFMPDLCPDPVPVESMYDGQVFGDAKVAAWRDAQDGPPRRKGAAMAQEDTILLRICAGAYRQAMGLLDHAKTEDESRQEAAVAQEAEEDESAAALLPDVRRKVMALSRSPLFEGANRNNLALLASNLQEVTLRYDDVFIENGQALQACFLVSEGYLRVSVPPLDLEAPGMGSFDDADEIMGMGLPGPGSVLEGSAQGSGTSASRPCSTSASRPGSARRPPMPEEPLGQPVQSNALPSRFELGKANGSDQPFFQFVHQPLVLPPASGASVSSGGSRRAFRLTPRKPGTPRRGTPWEQALRQRRTAPFAGIHSSDIEMCQLHAGEVFGLAALYDPKGECPYVSSCEVRVQSSEARILVLTNGSLLYLNETLARTLVDRAKGQEDPVAPPSQHIKRERNYRSYWTRQKLRVLDRLVMHED